MKETLEKLFGDFLERQIPELTPRFAPLDAPPGKALALIGMRRVGKTYLCYQRIGELLASGIERERILYLNFEDDRLFGFGLSDFQTILDVFYAAAPEKKSVHCYFFFDEIQNVPNWERFVRRLIDTEDVSVTVTGSSAKLLSAELATGLRGRSLDLEVFPFSFKEYLEHHAIQLPHKQAIGAKTRLALNQHAELYCRKGGLPELQKLLPVRAREVAQSYVDAVVLRDVIERHGVSNVEALRSLLYKVLREPATKLSIHKVYQDFKSRGLRVSKDDLYAFMRHLADAYLLFQLPLWTRSEKKRQVNPKKVYVIDNGILDAYSTQMTADQGALLENLVYITLRRQIRELGYYETRQGYEVDFAYREADQTVLVQAAWSLKNERTRQREVRALMEADQELTNCRKQIITLDEETTLEDGEIEVLPLWKFLGLGR
ncbi:MAG: ATP-binding protein [Opitutales bacterium]